MLTEIYKVEYIRLGLAIVWPILATIKVIYDTQGVCFAGGNNTTDNEKMLHATQKISFFSWPSKIHSIENSRAETREYWVLALKFIQLFFRNKISDHVNFTLALLANCVSSILIYFVIGNYFSPNIGLIASLFYSTSIWAYQIIFVIGHVHLAQMFFLFAVLSLQAAFPLEAPYTVYFYFLAGILTIVSFAASSASRKYPILAIIALIYSLREQAVFPWEVTYFSMTNAYVLGSGLLTVVSVLLFSAWQKSWIEKILRKVTGKPYLAARADMLFQTFLAAVAFAVVFWTLFPEWTIVFKFVLAYFLGVLAATLHLLLPVSELKTNGHRYGVWLMAKWRSHFNSYPDQVAIFGKQLPEDFRGEGLPWVPRLFWRVVPVVFVFYICSFLVVVYDAFTSNQFSNVFLALIYVISIAFVSLLPVIVSELTSSLQVGKAYFPSLIGFLLMLGFGSDVVFKNLEGNESATTLFVVLIASAILLQWGQSLLLYFGDVLPARMAATRLRSELRRLNVKTFYTYDNPYSDSFVNSMLYSYPDEFDVKYIDSIGEVREGVIVIPGTSAKSEIMEGKKFAVLGDFRGDKVLNKLYENRDIEKLADSKIRTRGCSRYFVLETEVTGYRDLILKQVGEYDRWIANGWILSAETVHKHLAFADKG